MSELTDSGHKHGKIKESKCHEQCVLKKLTLEGPFPYWFVTQEQSVPEAVWEPATVPTSGLHCKTKDYILSG